MPATPKVWLFQPEIRHYRTAVFDGLVAGSGNRYHMTVLGSLQNGKAFGGEARHYHRQSNLRTRWLLGQPYEYWTGATAAIRNEKPDAVVTYLNPRNINCWTIPALCQNIGAASVGWTKVHSFSGLPTKLLQSVKRRLFQKYDLLIAYGKLSEQELINLGYPKDRIYIAQNTIDTRRIFENGSDYLHLAKLLRQKFGLTNKRILLYVGRMDPEKRPNDLLNAWPKIKQIDPNIVLALVGGGTLLDSLRDQAKQIDPQRIIVTGRVPENEDYAWIAASNLTIQCGAVGLAINQSLAFAKPTIIADEIGADTELVEHLVTGWRYPRGNLHEMAQVIRQILADPDATQRITNQAKILMRDSANIDNMVRAIDACIIHAIAISKERKSQP